MQGDVGSTLPLVHCKRAFHAKLMCQAVHAQQFQGMNFRKLVQAMLGTQAKTYLLLLFRLDRMKKQ